jgi:glycerol-3-phosphate dehydrogenase (NAD(P)+)
MRCAVIGAGAWGTALADLLAINAHDTTIWALEPDVAESINTTHENRRFLAGFSISDQLRATNSQQSAIRGASLVVFATPSSHLRRVATECAPFLERDAILVVATKGIEQDTLSLMTQVVAGVLPGHDVVGISGPSFAAEVVARQPTAVVAASTNQRAALVTQLAFSNMSFRVYTNEDVAGVELGGSLKNVMAVATGVVEGVGLGHNTRAALITRGLHEMTRLGVAVGARASTFAGLAGLGDLVLTCTGGLSRNRAIGIEIGKGASLERALEGKETVAEGVVTAASARALAHRHGVVMPIVEMVNRVLFEGHVARSAVSELMTRELRSEQDP